MTVIVEFCGVEHHSMLFDVRAVPPEEYEDWLDEQRKDQR